MDNFQGRKDKEPCEQGRKGGEKTEIESPLKIQATKFQGLKDTKHSFKG